MTKWFWLLTSAVYCFYNYFDRAAKQQWFRGDFEIYYNFVKHGIRDGWYYQDILSAIWIPFTLLPLEQSFIVWYILCSMGVIYTVKRILEIRYGWLTIPFFLKASAWTLGTGNVYPLLIPLCFTPVGTLVAGIFKPQLLVFMAFHAFIRYHVTLHEDTKRMV
jgi:hypothetical protein